MTLKIGFRLASGIVKRNELSSIPVSRVERISSFAGCLEVDRFRLSPTWTSIGAWPCRQVHDDRAREREAAGHVGAGGVGSCGGQQPAFFLPPCIVPDAEGHQRLAFEVGDAFFVGVCAGVTAASLSTWRFSELPCRASSVPFRGRSPPSIMLPIGRVRAVPRPPGTGQLYSMPMPKWRFDCTWKMPVAARPRREHHAVEAELPRLDHPAAAGALLDAFGEQVRVRHFEAALAFAFAAVRDDDRSRRQCAR